jgi:hypothetical protein
MRRHEHKVVSVEQGHHWKVDFSPRRSSDLRS